jgi:hypothetical protein
LKEKWENRKKVDAVDQGMKRQTSDLDKRKNKFPKHDNLTNDSLMNDSLMNDDSSSGSSVIEETSFGQTSFGEPSRKHF